MGPIDQWMILNFILKATESQRRILNRKQLVFLKEHLKKTKHITVKTSQLLADNRKRDFLQNTNHKGKDSDFDIKNWDSTSQK